MARNRAEVEHMQKNIVGKKEIILNPHETSIIITIVISYNS